MQQQIYIESQQQQLPELGPISASPAPQPLEELISEHYDQDFDSISDIPSMPNSEIEEEVSSYIENPPQWKVETHCIEAEQTQEETSKLQDECLTLQAQIQALQKQLAEAEVEPIEPASDPIENHHYLYQHLLQEKQNNQLQLASQKQQLQAVLASFLGKDSLSTALILAEIDSGQNSMIQERLIEEGVRFNALLHCTANQIGKLKREIDKNGHQLSVIQQVKEEMRAKHHCLFRQIEQKKQKLSKNEGKIEQMNLKVEELHLKMAKLSVTASEGLSLQPLKHRWQVQLNQKEKINKKIKMVIRTLQQSIAALKKNISDLKRHHQQLDQSLSQLCLRNTKIEEESNKNLEQFNKLTKRADRRRSNYKVNHFITQQEHLNLPNQYPYQSTNTFLELKPTNVKKQPQNDASSKIYGSDLEAGLKKLTETALDAEIWEEDVIKDIQTKLKESSTDGALRKQFKLKLPHKPTASKQFLDLSQVNSPKAAFYIKMNQTNLENAKLSVTERLRRIERLEKEDRRYSLRLQAQKQRKIDSDSRQSISNLMNTTQCKPENKNNQMRSSSCYRNDQFPAEPVIRLSHSVAVSQKNIEAQAASPLKAGSNLEVDADARLPALSVRPSSKTITRKNAQEPCHAKLNNQTNNIRQKVANYKHLNLQNLLNPKVLFSSIQQKLLMRQSSACGTFNLSQDNSFKIQEALIATAMNSSFQDVSRVSRQSSMVRRREKKISDEYMKILEQRGRRILQLENETD